MTPYVHQSKIAEEAYKVLKENMIVYLAMEERTGKTLTSILVCEKSSTMKNILVITKKKAITGWEETIEAYNPKLNFRIINFESVHKISFTPDLVIIDEAHSKVASYPKVSQTWKNIFEITKRKPLIYLSATPSAQSLAQLYHQFKLSSWSPWIQYSNFYKWFKDYGIVETEYVSGRPIKKYNKTYKDKVRQDIDHLFISYTRDELGFEHEPQDIKHYIELSDKTKEWYNNLLKYGAFELNETTPIIADTPMSLRTKLHQIEGGTLKYEDTVYTLSNTEKINYIKQVWGDTTSLVIFYQYKKEEVKLKEHFKKATILQGTSYAEGVDLHKYDTCVVYSMDFSTAKYTQRRARQCNMKRDKPIDFHFLLVKDAISDQCYTTVADNKENFVDKYFDKKGL